MFAYNICRTLSTQNFFDTLLEVSKLCKANGSLLIVDKIQTGLGRTGPMIAFSPLTAMSHWLTTNHEDGG